MEISQQLEERLGAITNYDDFFELRRRIQSSEDPGVFHALWRLALERTPNGASGMAGYMLAELQPDLDEPLNELLRQVHMSLLDASNRIVPFYLVSQFGRAQVTQAAAEFLATVPESPRSRVDAVLYWSSFPASELCKPFHDWEAREMYGVSDEG